MRGMKSLGAKIATIQHEVDDQSRYQRAEAQATKAVEAMDVQVSAVLAALNRTMAAQADTEEPGYGPGV